MGKIFYNFLKTYNKNPISLSKISQSWCLRPYITWKSQKKGGLWNDFFPSEVSFLEILQHLEFFAKNRQNQKNALNPPLCNRIQKYFIGRLYGPKYTYKKNLSQIGDLVMTAFCSLIGIRRVKNSIFLVVWSSLRRLL